MNREPSETKNLSPIAINAVRSASWLGLKNPITRFPYPTLDPNHEQLKTQKCKTQKHQFKRIT